MSARHGEILFSAEHDRGRVHRRVVQVGATAAWVVAALFVILGFFTRDMIFYLDAVGPILAACFMTTLVLLRKEHGGIALFGCGFAVVVMHTVVGDPRLMMAVGLALVVVSSLAMLFVERRRAVVIALIALAMAVSPLLWGLALGEAMRLGASMSLGFVMTTLIFSTVGPAKPALIGSRPTLATCASASPPHTH